MKKISIAAAVSLAAFSTCALAGTFSLSEAQSLVSKVSHHTAKAVKVFSGPYGLHGMLVKPSVITPQTPPSIAKGQIAWATPNGKGMIMGPVVGSNGKNYTLQAMYNEGLLQRPMAAKVLYEKAQKADSFVVGTKGPEIVAMVDPNCIFCHLFYEKVMPYVHQGKVRVRFVVAGFLKPSSQPKAETILSSKDPAAAWAYDEAHFRVRVEEGGAKPDKNPTPAVVKAVEANTHLLSESGEIATPTLIYRDKDGKYRLIHGLPRDFSGFISQVTAG